MEAHNDDVEFNIVAFCEIYGFDQYITTFDDSYNTVIGDGGVSLSGGQSQLVALARALYQSPDFLILDEPTASMDSEMEKWVMNLLNSIKKHMIVLMVTHRIKAAYDSDYVYLLKNGEIVEEGNPKMMAQVAGNPISDYFSI